nr:MerR family transcriptional regulator [Microbacterium testaceum]
MNIGEAASEVGVATHVLRHWDATGVVVPDRDTAGRRQYAPEHVTRLRILRACQRLGMSLPEIRTVLTRDRPDRRELIEARLQWIAEQRSRLDEAEAFLSHVIDCRAQDVTRCQGWLRFAGEVD